MCEVLEVSIWHVQSTFLHLYFLLALGYFPFQFVSFNLISTTCVSNFLICEYFNLREVFNFFEFKLVLSFVVSKLFICETFSLWWHLYDIHWILSLVFFFSSFVVLEVWVSMWNCLHIFIFYGEWVKHYCLWRVTFTKVCKCWA